MNRHIRSHKRRRRENTSHICTLCSLNFLHKIELNDRAREQHMGEDTSAAQTENNNGAHLLSEPLLTPSNEEKPVEPLFRGTFSQLSAGCIAVFISDEHMTDLNNLYIQSFFGIFILLIFAVMQVLSQLLPMKNNSHLWVNSFHWHKVGHHLPNVQ